MRIKIVLLFCVLILSPIAGAQELRDTYANGIYFDHDGRPQYPQTFDTADTLAFLFDTPGYWPTGLTKQGATLFWLADDNADSSMLYVLSNTGGVVTSYDAPLNGYAGLEYDDQYLWAVYEHQFELHRINRTNGQIDSIISMPLPDTTYPDRHAWGIAWDGTHFWHSQYGQDALIFKIDPSTWMPVDTIMPSADFVLALAWADPFLFGIDMSAGRIYRFDPDSAQEIDNYEWPVNYPLGLYYDNSAEYFINVSSRAEYGGDEAVYLVGITTGIDEPPNKPSAIDLITAYPNPFNAATSIRYSLVVPSHVTLDIYNVLGQRVERLIDLRQGAGDYNILWHPEELSAGVYIYRIHTDYYQTSKKITLLK